MRIAIGADHAGYDLKNYLYEKIESMGHSIVDVGSHTLDPDDDYPDFAKAVGKQVSSQESDRGILVCGSGVGASIAANKIVGIRASICHDIYSAHQGVEHDDMNVLCIGALVVEKNLALELASNFIKAKFSGKERHIRRLNKVFELESNRDLI
tara:strand:+ start:3110 stop:3568 length:459 start_codon:yes stop_codon:yes gene_type:complete